MHAIDRYPPSLRHGAAETSFVDVLRLLEEVEGHHGGGILDYQDASGEAAGAIVVDAGRVCFVRGIQGLPRFTELLAERHPECAKLLSRAVEKARGERRLIGESLAELGQLPLAQIRGCLRDQVACGLVALASLADEGRPPGWGGLVGSFDERLTFSTVEILEAAAVQLCPEHEADGASTLYAKHKESARCAVLAVRTPSGALAPVDVVGCEVQSVAELAGMGRHLLATARPPTLAAAGVKPHIVSFGAGDDFGVACVGPRYVALLGGLTSGGRVRVLGDALAARQAQDPEG